MQPVALAAVILWPVFATAAAPTCSLADQSKTPGDLNSCPKSSLFSVRGNPVVTTGRLSRVSLEGLYQRSDGSFHAGSQCHPEHYTWGNTTQCAATSKDFVYWEDANSWENPRTLWPSQLFDIRGVFRLFDGSCCLALLDQAAIRNPRQSYHFPTGIRDPYIFTSPTLSNLSGNSSGATGDHFLTISSGIHAVAPRLLLYRQNSNDD
ncbi:hypothetical protein R3P38DRAFT_3286445, partial [Favolaschia claudopus]